MMESSRLALYGTKQFATAGSLHVAIIMDGNGRWARDRRLPRSHGHREGAEAVRRVVERAPLLGIGVMTLYAFSSDNWNRPRAEVEGLMSLFRQFLEGQVRECRKNGVRLSIIGRRDRLNRFLVRSIEQAERETASNGTIDLRIAIDYSARDVIVRAACRNGRDVTRDAFRQRMAEAMHSPHPAPDVDLLVRTGRERRLSDFLLWECAYAELWFSDTLWPDFTGDDLERAVSDFRGRERRFGSIGSAESGTGADR